MYCKYYNNLLIISNECKHWNMKLYFNHHSNFIIRDIIIIADAMEHVDQSEINGDHCNKRTKNSL